MTRRVHFAPTNAVYSDGLSTPSPSHSISSLPSTSSPDLPTPPPEEEDYDGYPTVVYPRTPYAMNQPLDLLLPEIMTPPKSMQIHFLLAYTPYSDPALVWDLSIPPPHALNLEGQNAQISRKALFEPATSPPLESLFITHPYLKWNIEVLPQESGPGAFVSVGDVVDTLYRELRLAIHPIEYAELSEGDMRSEVDNTYYQRCGRIIRPEARMMEQKKGIKRVDLLLGRTRFLGLSGTLSAPDIWELNVS